ncbi:DUF805 domain-containing protein [Propionispira raffinosivorans]|uniref:DUF805 domain-containing protein n=1 Tax=Propionispira raffinosivorans TaxID=86959 RepID=UPI00037AB5F6|nr:DUF805 domain-containing protein [Propionispira raffinosivorans]
MSESFKKNYLTFNGRLNRKKYFMQIFTIGVVFGLATAISSFIVGAYLSAHGDNSSLSSVTEACILFLAILSSPFIASLYIRRLHDFNFKGWWMIIGFILIFPIPIIFSLCLLSIKGTKGQNRFGNDPLVKPQPVMTSNS